MATDATSIEAVGLGVSCWGSDHECSAYVAATGRPVVSYSYYDPDTFSPGSGLGDGATWTLFLPGGSPLALIWRSFDGPTWTSRASGDHALLPADAPPPAGPGWEPAAPEVAVVWFRPSGRNSAHYSPLLPCRRSHNPPGRAWTLWKRAPAAGARPGGATGNQIAASGSSGPPANDAMGPTLGAGEDNAAHPTVQPWQPRSPDGTPPLDPTDDVAGRPLNAAPPPAANGPPSGGGTQGPAPHAHRCIWAEDVWGAKIGPAAAAPSETILRRGALRPPGVTRPNIRGGLAAHVRHAAKTAASMQWGEVPWPRSVNSQAVAMLRHQMDTLDLSGGVEVHARVMLARARMHEERGDEDWLYRRGSSLIKAKQLAAFQASPGMHDQALRAAMAAHLKRVTSAAPRAGRTPAQATPDPPAPATPSDMGRAHSMWSEAGDPCQADFRPLDGTDYALFGTRVSVRFADSTWHGGTLHGAADAEMPFAFLILYDDGDDETVCRSELRARASIQGGAGWPWDLSSPAPWAEALLPPAALPPPTRAAHSRGENPTTEPVRSMVWNCQGMRNNSDSLTHAVAWKRPHLIFLSETFLVGSHVRRGRFGMSGFTAFHTTTARDYRERGKGRARGGVCVLISEDWADAAGVRRVPTPRDLLGYLSVVEVACVGGDDLLLAAAYVPPGQENEEVAAKVRAHLLSLSAKGQALIVGGDFNGVLLPTERPAGKAYPGDLAHRRLVSEAGLSSSSGLAHASGRRPPTYVVGASAVGSRIDDVLTGGGLPPPHEVGVIRLHSLSHHHPLVSRVHAPIPCGRAARRRPDTQHPVPRGAPPGGRRYDTAAFTQKVSDNYAAELAADATLLRQVEAAADVLRDGAPDGLDRATEHLIAALSGAQERAESLPVVPSRPGPPGQDDDDASLDEPTDGPRMPARARPRVTGASYATRAEQARRRALLRAAGRIEEAAARACDGDPDCAAGLGPANVGPPTPGGAFPTVPPPEPDSPPEDLKDWAAGAAEVAADLRQRATRLSAAVDRRAAQVAGRSFRHALGRDRKRATRALFGGEGPPLTLTEVAMRDGTVSDDPGKVIAEVENYFTTLQTPGGNVDLEAKPWLSDLDPVELPGPLTEVGPLGDRIDAESVATAIRRIPRRRAPGPDGILGETIKCAPPVAAALLHSLFRRYWSDSHLPACLQSSRMVLLYKKGDHRRPENYRPIALANTVAKTYTMVVTTLLSDAAEEHAMLSPGQEGFRPLRHTTRQIRMVTSALEDACLSSRDIGVTYVDFSSAFNTVPHDGLLAVMRDMGFPADAVSAVGAVYRGAVTRFATPHGETADIPIRRGTIQGDCLSPLLWNIFMDPLLRWLEAGGRGYRYTTSDTDVSAAAYADDLALLTGTRADARAQMAKVCRYAEWAGLSVNLSKCAHTALQAGASAHPQEPLPFGPSPTGPRGKAGIPWLPSEHPYKYLGVELTATLDWGTDTAEAMARVEDRTGVVCSSAASLRQRLMLVGQNAAMSAAYKLAAGGHSTAQVRRVDSYVARGAKSALGAPRSTAGAFVFAPRASFGWGVPSLEGEAIKTYGRSLLEALRDDDNLGRASLGLVREHLLRAAVPGPGDTVALHEAYRCTLPVANMLRTLAGAGVYLDEFPLPVGAGGLMRTLAASPFREPWGVCRNYDRPEEASSYRPQPLLPYPQGLCLTPLWRCGCYSLGDVCLDRTEGVVCTPSELEREWLARNRGVLPKTPGLNKALRAVTLVACTKATDPWLPALECCTLMTKGQRTVRDELKPMARVKSDPRRRPAGPRTDEEPRRQYPLSPRRDPPSPSGAGRVRRGTDVPMEGLQDMEFSCTVIGGAPYGTPDRRLLVRWPPERHSPGSLAKLTAGGYVPVWTKPEEGGLLVQFADSWESEEMVGSTAVDAFDRGTAGPPAWLEARRPAATAATRDGSERLSPAGRDKPAHLDMTTCPCNPERDVEATGAYGVVRYSDGLLGFHDPLGHVRSTVVGERAALLAEWNSLARHEGRSDVPFHVAAHACIAHYTSKSLNLSNHWATPQPMVEAIAAATMADTERFCSPMNAHPLFRRRYTYRRDDAAFGAEYDAYSVRFSGSWYMNPEYDAEELTRALRWAQASAATDPCPNFGIAVLPRYAKAGHTGLLSRPGTHVLCTLPEGFRFAPQDAWAGDTDHSTGARFAVDLVAVYNEGGRTKFGGGLGPGSPLEALLRRDYGLRRRMTAPPAVPTPLPGRMAGKDPARPMHRWPPGFSDAPREAPLCPGGPRVAPPTPPLPVPPRARLRWADQAQTYAYTDGSHAPGGRAGAGVWLPNGLPDGRYRGADPGAPAPPTCLHGTDDPPPALRGLGGAWAEYTFGGVQTSIRAELVAIREAVRLCKGDGDLVVFTDCLSAMNMLRRWWHAPNTMLTHHDRPLVASTAAAIESRVGRVHLAKVRSHVGVPGNEAADAVAALAASGEGAARLGDADSVYPRGVGMATSWRNTGLGDPGRPPGPEEAPSLFPSPTSQPAEGVKYRMYNAPTALRRIAARTITRRAAERAKGYAQAMGDDPLADGPFSLLPAESNALWSRLPDSALRTCVKVRSNQFFAGPAAHAAGMAPTDFCTICPNREEHDGWQHLLCSCSHDVVHGLRCLRHNEVARVLVNAVKHGRKGRATVIADLREEPADGARFGGETAGSAAAEEPQSMPPAALPHTLHGWTPPEEGEDPYLPGLHDSYDPRLEDLVEGTGEAADEAVRSSKTGGPPVLVGAELWDGLPAVRPAPGDGPDSFHFTGRQSRTIPAWALRTSLTPDLVIIEGVEEGESAAPGDPGVVFTLADVTLTTERGLERAGNGKATNYEPLRRALTRAGWRVKPFVPLAFGVRGGIPRCALTFLAGVGVNPTPSRAALTRVHMIACNYLRRICHFKRVAEAATLGSFRVRARAARARRGGQPGGPSQAPPGGA